MPHLILYSSGERAVATRNAHFRELCSGLLMRLFGRSLVVTADVMLAHALGRVQQELRQLATNINIPGGVVPKLASLTGLDRDLSADLVEETLQVCARYVRTDVS